MEMVKQLERYGKEIDPDIEFKYIYLIDQNLQYCRGCCRCLTNGGQACPLNDDKEMILEEMHRADGLVFASPGYAHMVSGLFKNFIDRFMYLDHIPELINKPAVIISTAGGDGVNGAPNYMNKMSFRWWACNIIDTIGIAHAFYKLNDKYQQKINRRLKKAAETLLNEIASETKRHPSLGQYMCFKMNQAELVISPTVMPYRTKIWTEKNWMRQDYYYPVRVNLFFRFLGASAILMMRIAYRLMIGKDMAEKMKKYLEEN